MNSKILFMILLVCGATYLTMTSNFGKEVELEECNITIPDNSNDIIDL